MPQYYQRLKSYLSYWLNAVNQHSLQGPFIYDIFSKVFKNKKKEHPDYTKIAKVRARLEQSEHTLVLKGFGAGSVFSEDKNRSVSSIAKNGVTNKKYGELLHRLVAYTESTNILELGTSLGISTLYLSAHPSTKVTTIEGEEQLVNLAESIFESEGIRNASVICDNIDSALPKLLLGTEKLDFVFFDANHTKEATLSYFRQCLKKKHDKSCFVFDDIHWSKSMEEAWEEIKADFNVTLTIDVYQLGIAFFNPEIIKQHYVLEY